MSIQAIIMAGGAGTRLRPLTCDLPKPLAPLCGAPVMDYSLRLLQRHGIRQATATLWYRPDDIRARFGSGRHGVALSYMTETEPVGTAGSVLLAAEGASSTVLVLSGDGLTGVNLDAALAFHRARNAAATLVLRHVDIPLPYGVVVTDGTGRIQRFIEKPDWSRVVSSLVNTGVYLLEPEALALIPRDRPFDFGKELFPLMLEKGLPLYGYESDAYWCDVGGPAAFLQAQADLLAGKTGFSIEDPGIRSIACADISADSYVADSVRIGKGAVLRHACVLEDAVIGPGAHIDSAIICPRARVGRGAELHKDSVLGAGSALGDFGHLTAGASVWPGIMLPASAAVTENVRQREPVTVCQGKGQAFFPAQQAQLCGAFLQEASVRTLAVMQDGRSAAAYHTVLGALTAYGAERVWMLGRGTVGMLAHAVNALHAQGGLLCRADGFLLLDQNGLPLNSKVSARVEATALRQELPALAPGSTALRAHASLRADYLRFLAQAFVCEKGARVSLLCKDRFLRAAAKQAFSLAGHTLAGDGIPLVLEEQHARLLVASRELTPLQQWLLYAHALQAEGLPVYDSQDWGWTGEGILPCDGSEACITQQRWRQDGLAQALILLQLFARETPEEALLSLPEAVHSALDIPCHPEEKGHVLESLLADAAPRPQGGLAAVRGNARAVIRPDPVLPLLHISAFARDTEHARELCDFYAGKVRSALHERL